MASPPALAGIAELFEEAPLALLFKVDNPIGKKTCLTEQALNEQGGQYLALHPGAAGEFALGTGQISKRSGQDGLNCKRLLSARLTASLDFDG